MKKKNYEQYKRMVRVLAVAVILIVEAVLFQYVWNHYYSAGLWIEPFYAKGNFIIVGIYVIFLLLFMYIYGGLKFGMLRTSNMVLSQALAGLCANVLMYLQIVLLSRHLVAILPMLLMTVVEVLLITLFSWLFNGIYRMIFPARKLLLIYEDYEADALITKMNSRSDKYRIVKMMSVHEDMKKLEKEILLSEGVVLNDIHSELRNVILKYCYTHSIRTYMTAKISDILIRSSDMLHLFDTPLLLSRNYGLNFEQRFGKRCLDLILSIPMTILFSPFMLFTAIAIKLYDHGPVIYKQERLTIDGKKFNVYKFRSMIMDAEKDGVARLAKSNDSRITPIGKFIRKTRLDELPQIINVLRGDMSLVGPRPERPEIATQYEESIPEFQYRLKVKAGLTGYAQLYGKYNTTPYDKLKLDLMYIQSYSMLLDLKLIILTFKILFMSESTEGVDENKTIAGVREKEEKVK